MSAYGTWITLNHYWTILYTRKRPFRHARIVGFEELGGIDDFPTTALEMRLRVSGAISNAPTSSSNLATRLGMSSKKDNSESDGEDDEKPKRNIRSSKKDSDDGYDL